MKIPSEIRWKATGRTIGEGGQGKVIEVTDSTDAEGAKYALKALGKGRRDAVYQRFEREIRAIQTLDHPSIVRVVDYSLSSEFPYYVMDLVAEGISLKWSLEHKSNPFYARPLAALGFFRRLLEVVAACETIKVVHRDLSPANVLVLPTECIKVIDFGLCQIDGAEPVTLVDEGVGTQNYMAPECEAGSGAPVSSAADMYSAGKLLWSAITGFFAFAREKPAFQSKSMEKMFPKHPAAWHLQAVFSRTIRQTVTDRWPNASKALEDCSRIEYLIQSGYAPLSMLASMFCPVCGMGELQDFHGSHMVFGNPGLRGIAKLQCDRCGFCFPVNTSQLRASVQAMHDLE